MLWKSVSVVISCLVAGSAIAGKDPYTSDLPSENLPNLVATYAAMNSACRDSPDAHRECDRRDAIYREIQIRGWCWGPEDAIGADQEWVECPSTMPPIFDAPGHCKAISSLGDAPSEVVMSSCMIQEQSAYDLLKGSWASIPASTQKHCTGISKLGGQGSYIALSSCIRQEVQAKKSNANSSFHY